MDGDLYGKGAPTNSSQSSRSGVVFASPTQIPAMSSDFDFDLNSINKDGNPTGRSLPGFQVAALKGYTVPNLEMYGCPCNPNCDQLCCKTKQKSVAPLNISSHQLHDDTLLVSPVDTSSNPRSTSPTGSYESVDSTEEFIPKMHKLESVCAPGSVVRGGGYDYESGLETSARCGCHVRIKDSTSRRANTKLIIASVIALLFMIGEVLGGYFAGSLAIMTDAAHMLSDLAGFLISLFAIWVGSRPPSKRMSFGWHRAEVIGAIISVLIVWVLTGVLFYEAILRVINPDLIDVKADIMLVTACVGVFVNVFMCAVLGHGHGHSHGGGGHGHSHGGGGNGHSHGRSGHSHGGIQGHDENPEGEVKKGVFTRLKKRLSRKKKQESAENINVRAAFVHVIGDLIQSIGVVIAGYLIWLRPDWKVADPICTFLFCVLVLFSTINVLKDALRVLMEGTPKHVSYEDVKADLQQVPGVKHAHSLHIWSLTTTRTALAAHLAIEDGAATQDVLERASKMLKEMHNIVHTTLQVEDYHNQMDDCGTCQEVKKSSSCWPR